MKHDTTTEETLEEIFSGAGLDPQDAFVRESLVDALNDALHALRNLSRALRHWIEG